MVTDILFPFYEILVNTIFGSVILATIVLAVIIFFILAICKTSWPFIVFWLMFYFMVMGTLYIGALGMVLVFILVLIYAFIALMRIVAGIWVNL